MTDKHQEYMRKMGEYLACFELIAKEACEARDYNAAIEANNRAVKMFSTINAAEGWFTSQDEANTEVVADQIVGKIMS